MLERDNFTCRFCGIKLSKNMTVDHMDGNASNNNLENFGLNCPSCDSFRHCGFHSMNGEIFVRFSKIP